MPTSIKEWATWRKWKIGFGYNIDIPIILLIDPRGRDHILPYEVAQPFFKYFETKNKKYLRKGVEKAKKWLEEQGYITSGRRGSVVDQEILDYLSRPENYLISHTVKEIATAIKRDPTYVWDRLQILVKKGKIVKIDKGRYMLKPSWMRR